MSRPLLNESNVHPHIRPRMQDFHQSVVQTVQDTVSQHAVVVIGMAQNPVCKKVRKNLVQADIPFEYLEYGSYLKKWKQRLAIKMWSGWPTFPQVFINGQLAGGNHEIEQLIKRGELLSPIKQTSGS